MHKCRGANVGAQLFVHIYRVRKCWSENVGCANVGAQLLVRICWSANVEALVSRRICESAHMWERKSPPTRFSNFLYFLRSLQGVCNWLICFNAIGSLIHQLGHFILVYFVLTGQNTTSLENCFSLQLFPAFFLNFGAFFTLAVGLDRLFIVLFPLK